MPRVTPLYYHYSKEPSICNAFDNTHVQYINDTLHIIRTVFKTPIYTLYQICKICVCFAVQYMLQMLEGCGITFGVSCAAFLIHVAVQHCMWAVLQSSLKLAVYCSVKAVVQRGVQLALEHSW